ncbi:trypsin-like serine protease [Linderina pennispora]|uniref:Trypsin-like serine protease n=1 Tax=Linderina pennispora TaxID=61395 RepID=A0A1Y1WDE0_9FUNG|nr:trypsin-like serine protease [Linderina pennispora]ORX71539.1 trypsin-like serine protease [Linderina pennispora]
MKFLVATVFGIGLATNSLGLPQSSANQDPHHHLSKRIVGGGVAPAGKYKFASIVKRFISTGTGMCGSTIISKNFVVTAGHCIVDDITNQINTPENIYIGYGSSEYKKQTLVQATKLFLHPQYDISKFENDIAIIQVPDLPVDGVSASTVPLYKGSLYPGNGNYSDWMGVDQLHRHNQPVARESRRPLSKSETQSRASRMSRST